MFIINLKCVTYIFFRFITKIKRLKWILDFIFAISNFWFDFYYLILEKSICTNSVICSKILFKKRIAVIYFLIKIFFYSSIFFCISFSLLIIAFFKKSFLFSLVNWSKNFLSITTLAISWRIKFKKLFVDDTNVKTKPITSVVPIVSEKRTINFPKKIGIHEIPKCYWSISYRTK